MTILELALCSVSLIALAACGERHAHSAPAVIATPGATVSSPSPEDALDAGRRRSLIDALAQELQTHYIFADIAAQMVRSLREHLARGDYDAIQHSDAFAAALTTDLRDVSHDLHLAVVFGRSDEHPLPSRAQPAADFGFGPIARLSGNVAHVVIHAFPPIDDDAARDAIAARMSQLSDAAALLVDLRTNRGGVPGSVALIASYLFDETPVHFSDIFQRDINSTEEYWTTSELRGKRFGSQKPVFVLTSKQTFSGGEDFAYSLQALHRATIIGETTAGGAHPVAPRGLDAWFRVLVPVARSINPITKTNWQDVGVVPDVPVPADRALEEAHHQALVALRSKSTR